MQEKLLCCCGASGWVRVIGWFEFIANSFYTVASILAVIFPAYVMELVVKVGGGLVLAVRIANLPDSDRHTICSLFTVNSSIENGSSELVTTAPQSESKSDLTAAIPGLIMISAIILIMAILGLAMSIVLLRGSYTNNARYLRAWLIYSGICLCLSALTIVGSIVVVKGGTVVMGAILFVELIHRVTQGFCWWIVYTHKSEIAARCKFIALSEANKSNYSPNYNNDLITVL